MSKPPKPKRAKIKRKNIPVELIEFNQWVLWSHEYRGNNWTKVPKQATVTADGSVLGAKSNDPSTWASYVRVIQAGAGDFKTKVSGIGFVFSADDPYVGVDLDNCLDEDQVLKPWASEIVSMLESTYHEVSPSGTGLKFWLRATFPDGYGNVANLEDGKIEVYHTKRFFTVTGQRWGDSPDKITESQEAMDWLASTHLKKRATNDAPAPNTSQAAGIAVADAIIEKIRQSKQAGKFKALFNDGNIEMCGGHSESDAALCSILAFWTNRDAGMIDQIFRNSALMRPKWDDKRNDGTYGSMTIQFAIANCHDTYNGKSRNTQSAPSSAPTSTGEDDRVEEVEEIPRPDLPDGAYRGLFQIYEDATRDRSEVCDEFRFASLKTAIGSVLGRSVSGRFGDEVFYPNFYSTLLGQSAKAKKSTAIRHAMRLMSNADTNVLALSHLATPEGLVALLADAPADADDTPEDVILREQARCKDEGTRLIVQVDEFANLLGKAKKKTSDGLLVTLTTAFDNPRRLDNPTKVDPVNAFNPSVSILAASTKAWLENTLSLHDIHGGFGNRFVYYVNSEMPPVAIPGASDYDALKHIESEIKGLRQRYAEKPAHFYFSGDASEMFTDWYKELFYRQSQSRNDTIEMMLDRLDLHVCKLALLFSALENDRGDLEIGLEQTIAACEMGEYWYQVVEFIFNHFAFNQESQHDHVLMDIVSKKRDISKRELQQRASGRGISSQHFKRSLEALIFSERVVVDETGNKVIYNG